MAFDEDLLGLVQAVRPNLLRDNSHLAVFFAQALLALRGGEIDWQLRRLVVRIIECQQISIHASFLPARRLSSSPRRLRLLLLHMHFD